MKSHINLFNQFRSGILFFTLIFSSFQAQPHGRDLDLSGEASGLYFVVLETRKGRLVKKVVKR